MKLLTDEEVVTSVIKELSLDPGSIDINSVEVLSALARRAAGLMCPCTKRMLIKRILGSLEGLAVDSEKLIDDIDHVIELLIAHGDLLEQNDSIDNITRRTETIIIRAPLSFVRRQSGACILLGVTPGDRPYLPDELQATIQYNNYNRVLPKSDAFDLAKHLSSLGLIELPYPIWSKLPAKLTPEERTDDIDRKMRSSEAYEASTIDGLKILDSKMPSNYYLGRWIKPSDQSGRYIARRPQAYGADLWCYVQMLRGKPRRVIDLPITGSRWRGCDEAWHIQAAIDMIIGNPQRYMIRRGKGDFAIVDLYSPIPSWLQRRWTTVGVSIPAEHCLLSFRFHMSELEEELSFARENYYLVEGRN